MGRIRLLCYTNIKKDMARRKSGETDTLCSYDTDFDGMCNKTGRSYGYSKYTCGHADARSGGDACTGSDQNTCCIRT